MCGDRRHTSGCRYRPWDMSWQPEAAMRAQWTTWAWDPSRGRRPSSTRLPRQVWDDSARSRRLSRGHVWRSAAYLGLSVQTLGHVMAARGSDEGAVDYLGVGPVWGTATKLDAATPAGVERLRQITSASPWPCVAIGGINLEPLSEVRRAGAAGAAVVSAICGQQDVAAATRQLRAAWDGASA